MADALGTIKQLRTELDATTAEDVEELRKRLDEVLFHIYSAATIVKHEAKRELGVDLMDDPDGEE